MKSRFIRTAIAVLSLLSVMALGVSGVTAANRTPARAGKVKSTTMGPYKPTYVGSAAQGCASGCSLLSGPTTVTLPASPTHSSAKGGASRARALVAPTPHMPALTAAQRRRLAQAKSFPVPAVSCTPLGAGCDSLSTSAGGATGVKGLNAVDSALNTPNIYKNVEPPDQALCAGNGSVMEGNNIGEIKVFNTALSSSSSVISLDTLMGLPAKNWSSGGDPVCEYDPANGGHWFVAQIVSASPESAGGAFTGCFNGVANECYEGIAVSVGNNPLGPYHVYFASADYNPAEPGSPSLLNDFAKIGLTRDAFMMFYDEFPLLPGSKPGFGGGIFNGAQEFAFNKKALETGAPAANVTVAVENMGRLKTPDGTCAKDKVLKIGGVTCWVAVIPGQPADSGQFDNAHGGTGFMFGTLDFYGFYPLPTSGDNRVAAWAWTGLKNLNSSNCSKCGGIKFQGQLFSGVDRYYLPEGLATAQKAGPIPLGNQCADASLSSTQPCPEGGLATNGDNSTQVSQAQNQLWTSTMTEVAQRYRGGTAEIHFGAVYWVIGTKSFDTSGKFTLTNQAYVTPKHVDLSMPAMAAEGTGGNGKAIMFFTVAGKHYYPSTAYGRLTSTSKGLTGSTINIADMGKSPQDGFSEYEGFPGPTRPRWGDYSAGIYLPGSGGKIYFANEYIQYPNCVPPAFQLHQIGTCGGTRNSLTNWGTSVNYVVP